MIPLSRPAVGKTVLRFLLQAIRDNEISQGPFIKQFEEEFAGFVGIKHGTACANGTLALFVALRALGVEDGEVIMPTLTFAATADAVYMAGAKPVFADVDENTLCLTPNTVAPHITKDTRAIITVGLYGVPARVKPLRRFNVPIIDDACESLGAKHGEADITCFSFFGNKVITTGEGGMACTDSHGLKEKMDMLRNHGRKSGYIPAMRGTNARMSNIHAAIGCSQMRDIKRNLRKRWQVLEWYGMPNAGRIGPWLMFVRSQERDALAMRLREALVDVREGFAPLHLMDAYRQDVHLPVAEMLGREVLLLPCHPDLTKKQVRYIMQYL